MATRNEIAALISRLMASYPNYHPADVKLAAEVYLEILGDLPADLVVMAAMQYASENHDFAPSAGTVRDYAMRIQVKSAGIPDAYQAYDEVIKKPERGKRIGDFCQLPDGTYGYPCAPVEWSHPIVESVAKLLGWPRRFPTDEPGVDRAQFVKAYDAQLLRYMTEAARLPIVQKYIEQESQKVLSDMQKLTKQLEGK